MANPLAESAVEAIELDAWAKEVPSYIPFDKTLYGGFKNNATIVPVSNVTSAGGVTRPSFRVPMRLQAGAAIAQGTGNGDSLGRGSGSQYGAFAVSPVFFYNVCEITYLARIATEGRKRGLFNVQAQELKNTYQQATQGLESLIQGDGTGTLDTIPSTATVNNGTGTGQALSSIVGLNNAFQFQDQQTIQVFTSGVSPCAAPSRSATPTLFLRPSIPLRRFPLAPPRLTFWLLPEHRARLADRFWDYRHGR